VIYLTQDEIIAFNESQIIHYGGRYNSIDRNVHNKGSFDYLTYIVQETVYGRKVCRTRFEVAAAYSFYIIKDHVFHDGCKRTGLFSAQVFLEKNGTSLNTTDEELKQFALDIEANVYDRPAIAQWYRDRKA